MIKVDERNTEKVENGSIVKCSFEYPGFTEEVVYEILDYGESNVDENKIFYDTPFSKELLELKG